MAEQRNEVRQPFLFLPLYLSFSLFLYLCVCVCVCDSASHLLTHTLKSLPAYFPISLLIIPSVLQLLSLYLFTIISIPLYSIFTYSLYFSARIREDGSFNIEYDDGDKEFKVPATRMRTLLKRKSNGQILVIVSYI